MTVIAAKPTLFGGRRFRSRTEARWAAFLDSLGVDWEYEPQPVPGWMPDFFIHIADVECYIEVKGSLEAAQAAATKNDDRFHRIVDELKQPILSAFGPPARWENGRYRGTARFHAWEPGTETHRAWGWAECDRCGALSIGPEHTMPCVCHHIIGTRLLEAASAMRDAHLGD